MAEPPQDGAPGDFHVEPDCCMVCGIPVEIAPDIFGWADDGSHCLVKRQPQTADESDRALRALWSAEVDCIRYRGGDRETARRIARFGKAHCCDQPPPWWVRPVWRDRVTFATAAPDRAAADLALRFRAFLGRPRHELPGYDVAPLQAPGQGWVRFSWTAQVMPPGEFHTVAFQGTAGEGRCGARLRPARRYALHGLALLVHDWLRGDEGASGVRWHSAVEAMRGAAGLHMPI